MKVPAFSSSALFIAVYVTFGSLGASASGLPGEDELQSPEAASGAVRANVGDPKWPLTPDDQDLSQTFSPTSDSRYPHAHLTPGAGLDRHIPDSDGTAGFLRPPDISLGSNAEEKKSNGKDAETKDSRNVPYTRQSAYSSLRPSRMNGDGDSVKESATKREDSDSAGANNLLVRPTSPRSFSSAWMEHVLNHGKSRAMDMIQSLATPAGVGHRQPTQEEMHFSSSSSSSLSSVHPPSLPSSDSIWTRNVMIGPVSLPAHERENLIHNHPKSAGQSSSIRSNMNSRRQLQQQQVGSPYFRQAGQAITGVEDTDHASYGRSISMSDDGMMLAVSGNLVIVPEEEFAGYVDLYRYDDELKVWDNLYANITTPNIVNEADVEVFLSGNGMRLALAAVHKDDSNDDASPEGIVTVYENNGGTWEVIGTPITGGFHGDRPGLKISMSYSGDRLAVSSRYYTDTSDNGNGPKVHAGRTRVFHYESGEWEQLGRDLVGDSEADYAGSSVALTPDGLTLAVGATGDDAGSEENKGRVKVYTFNANRQDWDQRGNEILGEAEDDESGFSVTLAKNGTRVAVGAIYNHGGEAGELRHSGHVRVYDFNAEDNAWKQIGSDIDGDFGSIYDGDYFHVGDALGFSVAMSMDGNKLAIGAPFYSKNRLSGYYGGVAKLYELVSNEWDQVAYDLNVTDTDATSGYSVALSSNGRRFAIGIPSPNTGMVLVYDQYEVSNVPSLMPSTMPTNYPSLLPTVQPSSEPSKLPSNIPTKQPSTRPSNQPSVLRSGFPTTSPSTTPSDGPTSQPSRKPSAQPNAVPSSLPSVTPTPVPSSRPSDVPSHLPSTQPSISPSTEPSLQPSSRPTSLPSNIPSNPPFNEPSSTPTTEPSAEPSSMPSFRPSNLPSTHPSDLPSFTPSAKPSAKPSSMPSIRPSTKPSVSPTLLPTSQPSQNPTSIEDRTFTIRSSYLLFERFSDGDTTWCIQASGFGEGSSLNVRQCTSKPSQLWYQDLLGNIRLRKFPAFCIVYEGKKLYVRSCDQALKPLDIDPETHSISVTKVNNKKFYICVDTFKAFSKLSLMKEGRKNSSWNTWHIEYEAPSLAPSMNPSDSSSARPSSGECTATFSNDYTDIAVTGEVMTISAEANSGVGYANITMLVSGCPMSATMHLWGAGGGGTKRYGYVTGGGGGYSTGLYIFQPGIYSIVVGGAGEGGSQSPQYNNVYNADITGGGRVEVKSNTGWDGAGGGGYTGVFSGDDINHSNTIIVAGGGGGGSGGYHGGGGGGLSGDHTYAPNQRGGSGGTQFGGGAGGKAGGNAGSQLQGGHGGGYGAGGGGGYYGGGGGGTQGPGAGGGGSGYIGGVTQGDFNASKGSIYWRNNVGMGGHSGHRGGGGQITFVFIELPTTSQPSLKPSVTPTGEPILTTGPSGEPSEIPSDTPSEEPSHVPSLRHSVVPSLSPSVRPSSGPTALPSLRGESQVPSMAPSIRGSVSPFPSLSEEESEVPSQKPSNKPSMSPSGEPSSGPSASPSEEPSEVPSQKPSIKPSVSPSRQPSSSPSASPSEEPSDNPSMGSSVPPSPSPSMQSPSGPTGEVFINFDDVEFDGTGTRSYFRSDIYLDNFDIYNGKKYAPGTGYAYGTISDSFVGFNNGGHPMTMSCPGGSFSIISVWMTTALFAANEVRLDGYKNELLEATYSVTLGETNEPKFFDSELEGLIDIDRLVITTSRGPVVWDDLTIEIIDPCDLEPSDNPSMGSSVPPSPSPSVQTPSGPTGEVFINFDDIEHDGTGSRSYFRSDIQMDNFSIVNGKKFLGGYGYAYGTISDPFVGFNSGGSPMTMSCPGGSFSIISVWMTGALVAGNEVRLDGYKNGSLKATYSVTLGDKDEPKFFDSELEGLIDIDRLDITTSRGPVVWDDLTIEIIDPCDLEPSDNPSMGSSVPPSPSPSVQTPSGPTGEVFINFDDIEHDGTGSRSYFRSDIQMDNFSIVNGKKFLGGYGYAYGTISDPFVGFNSGGSPMTMSCPGGSFSIISVWMTGALVAGNEVRLDGYKNGSLKATYSVTLGDKDEPKFFDSELEGLIDIDRLVITTSRGPVVWDDLTIEIIDPCNFDSMQIAEESADNEVTTALNSSI